MQLILNILKFQELQCSWDFYRHASDVRKTIRGTILITAKVPSILARGNGYYAFKIVVILEGIYTQRQQKKNILSRALNIDSQNIYPNSRDIDYDRNIKLDLKVQWSKYCTISLFALSLGLRNINCLLQRRETLYAKGVLSMTLNYLCWWGSCSRALGCIVNTFIALISRSSLTPNDRTC